MGGVVAILENLERFLLSELAVDPGKRSLDPDEDLLERGIIDSLRVGNSLQHWVLTFPPTRCRLQVHQFFEPLGFKARQDLVLSLRPCRTKVSR